MTRTLYLDLIGGAAGDMLLAALTDAGASLDRVREAVSALGLDGVNIESHEVRSAGLRARQIDVMVRGVLADAEHPGEDADDPSHHHHAPHHHHHHDHRDRRESLRVRSTKKSHGHRRYVEIRDRIRGAAALPDAVRTAALAAFARLAEAEAAAHGVAVEEVEFHEVGADDALTDIVGVATAFHELSPDEVVASPVPVGRGLTRGAHGPIPLPGPATLHLLKGAPLAHTELSGETVTPTGAALLATFVRRWGSIPSMTVEAIGVGAGHRTWPDRPNVVRALLGSAVGSEVATSDDDCIVEANLDDLHPQHLEPLERALFSAGALDVWSAPIHMKKGRIGVLVSALVPKRLVDGTATTFFSHSTTLGLRVTPVERRKRERRLEEVDTEYGVVRVKVAPRPGGPPLWMPEHDDCERLAASAGVPVRVVWEAALRSAWRR